MTLVESLTELVTEVVDDLYLAHFGQQRDDPELTYPDALKLAREVVGNPGDGAAPARPATRLAGRDMHPLRRMTFSPNWRRASAGWASWATTIC